MFENRVLRKTFRLKSGEVTGDERRLHNKIFVICTPHQILSGNQIKKNEIGGAWGTYGIQKRCIQGFGGESRGQGGTEKT